MLIKRGAIWLVIFINKFRKSRANGFAPRLKLLQSSPLRKYVNDQMNDPYTTHGNWEGSCYYSAVNHGLCKLDVSYSAPKQAYC